MMSHNQQITKLVASSVIEMCKANGTDVAKEFGTREAFTKFVFSASIKMVQQIIGCPINEAYDVVMGEGQFEAFANQAYASLTA